MDWSIANLDLLPDDHQPVRAGLADSCRSWTRSWTIAGELPHRQQRRSLGLGVDGDDPGIDGGPIAVASQAVAPGVVVQNSPEAASA